MDQQQTQLSKSETKFNIRHRDSAQEYSKHPHCSSAGRDGGDAPPTLRIMQLSLNYWVNQGYEQDRPTWCVLKPCWEKEKKDVKCSGWTATEEVK